MDEMAYATEDHLQALLARYPDLLPGDAIEPGDARRWLLIGREVGVPSEEAGTSVWSLDHLFVDQDGVPTLVEVKRSSDRRLRREVVGQLLDYAANAVAYWTVERLQSLFTDTCESAGREPEATLADFAVTEPDAFWLQVKTNLQAGRVRLIFLADKIPTELQRVIEFLNTQMDPAEVLAVEIPQFSGASFRTLVPRLVGQTVEARSRKSAGTAARNATQWTRESFLAALSERVSPVVAQTAASIIDGCTQRGLRSAYGRGSASGSYFPVLDHAGDWYAPFALWTYGQVETQFQWLKEKSAFTAQADRLALLERFNQVPGVALPADALHRRPSFSISLLDAPRAMERFFSTVDWVIEKVRGSDPRAE